MIVLLSLLLVFSEGTKPDVFEKSPGSYSSGIDPDKDLIPQDYDGVMSGISDRSEDASFRRYTLLNNLINNEPKLRTATSNMYAQLTNMYSVLKTKQSGVDNITKVIDADASAGGIRATVQSLKDQVPQASKMLRKMVETLFKNMATDAGSINQTLADTEDDYKERIKRASETVSGLLRSMDSQFAQSAYAQSMAMKRSANMLQSQFSSDIQSSQQSANKVLNSIGSTSNKTKLGVTKLSVALSDAADIPLQIESTYQSSLGAVTAQMQQLLNSQQDKAEQSISSASDKSISSVESKGMKMAKSVENLLNQIQTQLVSNVSAIETNVAKVAKKISQDAGRWNKKVVSNLDSTRRDVDSKLSSIQTDSEKIQVDSAQFASDTSSLLGRADTAVKETDSNFAVDSAKLRNLIPVNMQGVLTEATKVASGIGEDVTDELVRQNRGIGSIVETASSVGSSISSMMEKPVQTLKRRLTNSAYQTSENIASAISLVDRNTELVTARVNSAVTDHSDRLANLNALMSGGIDEVKAVIAESGEANQQGLENVRSRLRKKTTQGFSSILAKLKDVSSDDSLKEFISEVKQPSNERMQGEMTRLSSMLSNLLTSREALSDTQSNVWKRSTLEHEGRMSKVTSIGNQVNDMWTKSGGMIDSVKANANEAISRFKTNIREKSANELLSNSHFATLSLSTIKHILDGSLAQFWNSQNDTGVTLSGLSSLVSNAGTTLNQIRADAHKDVSRLGSFASSLTAEMNSQRKNDLKQTGKDIGKFQTYLIQSLRGQIQAETDAQLGEIISSSSANKKNSGLVKELLSALKAHMSRIDKDLMLATNEKSKRDSKASLDVSRLSGQVNAIRGDMETSFKKMSERVGEKIGEKWGYLNRTKLELNGQLSKLEADISSSGKVLEQNLLLYQGKIEKIISQIKSYMNLSSTADEVGIQNGIARELATVNKTAIEFAKIRAGMQDRASDLKHRQLNRTSSNAEVLGNLISAAESAASGKSSIVEANRQRLVSVGLRVDESANALRLFVEEESEKFDEKVLQSKKESESKLQSIKGGQIKKYNQFDIRASEVADQSRQEFVNQLGKMEGLDDDIALTTRQLFALMKNSKAALTDISTTVMNHMNMSVATQARLNGEKNKRIASIGDVMEIFGSVISKFVDEIDSGMRTVMFEMNAIESWSKKKMSEIKVRGGDELEWLKHGIAKVKTKFEAEMEAQRAIQQSLMTGLVRNNDLIAKIESAYKTEADQVNDRVKKMMSDVKGFGPKKINRVQEWIVGKKRRELKKRV
jgi:hypothetical protein